MDQVTGMVTVMVAMVTVTEAMDTVMEAMDTVTVSKGSPALRREPSTGRSCTPTGTMTRRTPAATTARPPSGSTP